MKFSLSTFTSMSLGSMTVLYCFPLTDRVMGIEAKGSVVDGAPIVVDEDVDCALVSSSSARTAVPATAAVPAVAFRNVRRDIFFDLTTSVTEFGPSGSDPEVFFRVNLTG